MATLQILAQNTRTRTEEFDLGAGNIHGFDGETNGGNLYLYIDGVEYGSIWVHLDDDGRRVITLGQFDENAEQWVTRNDIHALPEV